MLHWRLRFFGLVLLLCLSQQELDDVGVAPHDRNMKTGSLLLILRIVDHLLLQLLDDG